MTKNKIDYNNEAKRKKLHEYCVLMRLNIDMR